MRDYKPAPEIHCLRCGKSRADEPHGHCRTWGKSWPRHLWGPDHGDCETAGYCACDEGTCRISELEAEVERLKQPLSIVDQETGEQLHPDATITHRVSDVMALMKRAEDAEAKLAALEGLPRFGVHLTGFWMRQTKGPWVKYADIDAILRGESEGE